MQNKFFTSDLHFGHKNILKYCPRPWNSVEGMDEGLILNWNSVVKPNDVVYILGDVFFCEEKEVRTIMHRLNGKKRLVYGNHDKIIKNQRPIQNLFDAIYPELYTEYIDGTMVVMCHYPMLSWNKAFYGSFQLHGHMHNGQPIDGLCRRYDVGVDANNYFPVAWEHIKKTLEAIDPKEGSEVREARKLKEA